MTLQALPLPDSFAQPPPAPTRGGRRLSEKVCSNIVNKCLNGRSSTVIRATDVLMALVELEQPDKVVVGSGRGRPGLGALGARRALAAQPARPPGGCAQAELIAGFSNKVPKVVVASLDAAIIIIRCKPRSACQQACSPPPPSPPPHPTPPPRCSTL